MIKKILVALVLIVPAFLVIYQYGSRAATLNRPVFENCTDRKLLKKAYADLFRDIITGKITKEDADLDDDNVLDQLLLKRYSDLKLGIN
jgi:hypothetical protein